MAVAGLYLISGGLGGGGPAFGDGLTLGCAAAYAVHITLVEKLSPGKPVLALVGVQVWGVALASAACLPFRPLRIEWTGSLVGALIFSGVFSSVVAISLQTWAQSKTSSVRAALIFSLEPVFAAGYSVALGRERLGKVELLGGVLIVLGVVIGEVGGSLWSKARA